MSVGRNQIQLPPGSSAFWFLSPTSVSCIILLGVRI